MPIFNYKSIDQEGKSVKGQMTAANEIDLEQKLKEFSLDMVGFREVKSSSLSFGKVKIKDKIMLCIHLQQLDKAGVPIFDSLADVRDSTDSPKLKSIMGDVFESVKSGLMLSEALAKHPKVFDTVFTGLIAAGEQTGNLHASFEKLGNHMKWNADMRRKVKKAVTYPTATLFMIIGVIAFMMMGVVPQIQTFLEAQGQEMPGHTKALIATADFFGAFWYLVLLVPIGFIATVKILRKTVYPFAFFWDGLMLKMPLIGAPVRKIDLARFTHFFGTLYTSGIDILDCLKISQKVVRNKVLLDSIVNVRKIVNEGSTLTAALRASNQFPNLVIRMFKVGEESGNMKDALENVNFFYDREVNDAVDSIIGFIKPAMTVFLGLILAWIAIAMFGPLYDTIQQMDI